jgi:hypothetical protein
MRHTRFGAAFILAAGAAATFAWTPAPAPSPAPWHDPILPPPAQFAALEAQAAQACRCARKAGPDGKEGCWLGFEKAVSRYHPSEAVSMCGTFSEVWACFGDECIARDYGAGACSPEEAKTLLAAYTNAPPGKGDAAIKDAIRRMDAGQSIALAAPAAATACG